MEMRNIEDAKSRKLAPDVLTALDLEKFVKSESENREGKSALERIIEKVKVSDFTTISAACKAVREAHKDATDKEYIRVSMIRVKTIAGAVKFAGLQVTKGLHATYSEAVASLKAAGRKYDGSRVISKAEKAVVKEETAEAQVRIHRRLKAGEYENKTGKTPTPDQLQAWEDEAWTEAEQGTVKVVAKGLLKKHGADFCTKLIEALNDALQAEATANATKSKERDQAAALAA